MRQYVEVSIKMRLVFTNVYYILLFFIYNYLCLAQDEPASIAIGSFFEDDAQSKIAFDSRLQYADTMNVYKTVNSHISEKDSFKAKKILCNITQMDNGVAAIFGPNAITTTPIIESVCNNFGLPNIKFSWHPSTKITSENDPVINFYPKLSLLSHGIATIVKNLQWRSFVFLYESDEGLVKLQDILKLQTLDGSLNIVMKPLGPGPDYRPLLKEIRTSSENKIVLDCHTDNILQILMQAKDVNLTQTLYSFFLSSLDAHTVNLDFLDTAANITTIRIIDPVQNDFLAAFSTWRSYALSKRIPIDSDPYSIKTETVLVHDAVSAFIESVNSIQTEHRVLTQALNCDNFIEKWPFGANITNLMKTKKGVGISGPFSFDSFGQRDNFTIHLIENNRDVSLAKWNPDKMDEVEFVRSEQDTVEAQLETMRKGTIIVSSRLMAPYLMEKKPPENGERLDGNNRYEGFSMDLISEIAHILKFKFEFRLTEDGKYGNYDGKAKAWNGLIRDILEHKADLAICDLTITHQRREVVDFSMPFMRLGISILFKKSEEEPVNMFAFLDPFSIDVWIYTATLYLAVSVILYFVARMAPGDWENPHPCDQNPTELENIWDIKNCLWLTLGSIMTQGCDILPKGISSRLATSMWWFFSLIMTSSYTANLAAFLTMERMEPTIDSAEALSKQTKIKYGTVENGATQAFFRDSNYTPYARMWTNMQQDKPSAFEKDNAGGVNRVLSSTKKVKYAFLMESSQIEYEIATKCELKQVGKWLDSKGYGIAMPIDYPFRSNINEAILKLQEEGKLNQLKKKWWQDMRTEKLCEKPKSEEASSELSMENVGGVFLVLGIGVGIAFMIAIMEFLWNVRNVSVEQHITYLEALKIELLFAMNVWVTKKRTKPQISESSSNSSHDTRSIAPAVIHGGSIGFNLHIIQRTESQE